MPDRSGRHYASYNPGGYGQNGGGASWLENYRDRLYDYAGGNIPGNMGTPPDFRSTQGRPYASGGDVNRQQTPHAPGQEDSWTPDMSQLDWLIAQQQRRNPFREAMRLAKSGGYGQDVTATDAMRGAGANALGAMRDIKTRDAQSRTLDTALTAAPSLQGQRDSAIGQLLGTKYNIGMQGLQLQSQDELARLQLAQMGEQYDQTRSDNRRNQWMSLAGGVLGTGIGLLAGNPMAGFAIGSSVGNYASGASGRMSYAPPAPAPQGPMPLNAGGVGLNYSYAPQEALAPTMPMYQPRQGAMPPDAGGVGLDYSSMFSSPYLMNYVRPQAGTDSYRIRR